MNDQENLEELAIEIYQAYPRKIKRQAAIRAIVRVLRQNRVPYGELLQAVCSFSASQEGRPKEERRFIPYCSTWINGEQWSDDPGEWHSWKAKDDGRREPPGRVQRNSSDYGDLF